VRFIRDLIRSRSQLTIVLGLLAAVLVLAGALTQIPNLFASLLYDAGFALLVAILVAWVDVLFNAGEPAPNPYSSSEDEYRTALKNARHRIWIHNSWLARTDTEAAEILDAQAKDIRLLLASFRRDLNDPNGYNSFVFARLSGRGWSVADGMTSVCSTVQPFLRRADIDRAHLGEHLRFTFGHHPGWIAILDSRIFWGPTPIDEDNQARSIYFNVAPRHDVLGEFWTRQFERLWTDYSHDYEEERKYNAQLPELTP
jgi:hypothetical protein